MSTPVDEMRHPLAPHGWPLEPLVLIEDGSDGPYLAALLPPAEPTIAPDADLAEAELNDLADRLIAELTAPH